MNKNICYQIILQAIRDTASIDVKKVAKAYEWFGTNDFVEICESADLNPHHLRESLIKIINSKNKKKVSEDIISVINSLSWQKKVINN